VRRLGALLLVGISLALLASPPQAGAALPKKRYSCYVFYSPGVPTFTGRRITIVSESTYKWFNSKRTKSGGYRLEGQDRVQDGSAEGQEGGGSQERRRVDVDHDQVRFELCLELLLRLLSPASHSGGRTAGTRPA